MLVPGNVVLATIDGFLRTYRNWWDCCIFYIMINGTTEFCLYKCDISVELLSSGLTRALRWDNLCVRGKGSYTRLASLESRAARRVSYTCDFRHSTALYQQSIYIHIFPTFLAVGWLGHEKAS